MSYTDNPAADYARYDAKRKAQEDKLPKCAYCGEPIQDDFLYDFDGMLICEVCLEKNHRKWTEDYVG